MSDVEERIEEVLAAHRRQRGTRGLNAHCVCGWVSTERGESILRHEEHQAAMLAPVIAEAKAEALRAFADAIRDLPGDTTPRHTIERMARALARMAHNQENPNAHTN